MPHGATVLAGTLGAVLLAAALPAMSENIDVLKVRGSVTYGPHLVTDEGQSIYLFAGDRPGNSNCYGECAEAWPPVTTGGDIDIGDRVNADLVGTIERKHGREQVTYNKHPLYLFVRDLQPGMAVGHGIRGFGAVWYLVGADGGKVGEGAGYNPDEWMTDEPEPEDQQ